MMTGTAKLIISIGICLAYLQGLICRQLVFKEGIKYDYPSNRPANWTAVGNLRLTHQDLIIFEPLVTVQAMSEVCSIDLMSCAPEGQAPPTSEPCYCTGVSDEDYTLYVSSQGDHTLSDVTVQATVPSRYLFSPLAMTAAVGELPAGDKQDAVPDACSDKVKKLEKDLDKERHTLTGMIGELKKVDKMKFQIESQTSMIENQKDMILKLTKGNDDMSNQMTTLTNMLAEVMKDNKIMSNQITTLTNILTEVTKENKGISNEIMSQTKMISNLTDSSSKSDEVLAATIPPRECADVKSLAPHPVVTLGNEMEVVCDDGWVVFQRRASPNVDFYRSWEDYKYGFGNMSGNFWLGLEKVHKLTSNRKYELRIELVYKGAKKFASYNSFAILGESEKYKLLISGFSGDAGDSLSVHNGRPFSTKDRDNDDNSVTNCAAVFHGAWWYVGGCHHSNLNAEWGSTVHGKGINWYTTTGWTGSATFTEMKMRPLRPPRP